MFSVLGAEARRLMLPGPVVAAAHCKTHQKLEIFGNFVASRSAGPFVGRHFLLERHFAGEMISVGKARRCPFKQGSLNSGRFFEALLNSGERRGTHAYDLLNDKSRRPGASGGLVWWFSRKLALWWLFLKRMWGQSNDFSCFWSLKTGKIRLLVQKIRVAGRVRQVVA